MRAPFNPDQKPAAEDVYKRQDLNLNPAPDSIKIEVIMDGRIIDENLKKLGLDSNWLDKQLKTQGYRHAKEIFLGVCDQNNQLSLFAVE